MIKQILMWGFIGSLWSPLSAAPAILDASQLDLTWAIPFMGILLSIALGPIWFPKLWHQHYGKVSLLWSVIMLVALTSTFGWWVTKVSLAHTLFGEYFPFIILITSLYVINSGFLLEIRGHGGPFINAFVMLIGSIFANFVGTTGSALLFLNPLIRLNAGRKYKAHTIVFFIYTVCNIGGALTPIGDPPLFLGFLNGVEFFWPLKHLWAPTLFMLVSVLLIYMVVESVLLKRETSSAAHMPHSEDLRRFTLEGKHNFVFLAIVISSIISGGLMKIDSTISLFGYEKNVVSLFRDVILLATAACAYIFRNKEIFTKNHFSWEPIHEVALLFLGIFITAVPVFAMLGAGKDGPFAFLVDMVYRDGVASTEAFFWATGSLSAFLDNAPTYLVFFHLAGGDAHKLMTEGEHVLAAISCAAVYMGAMTYIGNAPNFIVKNIAQRHHIEMPSFFMYLLWACIVLLPLFYVADVIIQWW